MKHKKEFYVYHGSPNGRIKIFEPRNPSDIGDSKDNKHKGVYATNSKEWAMIMGILSGKNVGNSSTYESNKDGIMGVTYKENPKFNKYFYVYTFHSKDFKNLPKGSDQYICLKKIKPLKVEKFLLENYLKWIRPANKKEMGRFKKLLEKNKSN